MRGDPPQAHHNKLKQHQSTPHARGSTFQSPFVNHHLPVYPACAGIHLSKGYPQQPNWGLPRMRGDPPEDPTSSVGKQTSTPHARGSTVNASSDSTASGVYPACAGIHLCTLLWQATGACLPRMRGDPPAQIRPKTGRFASTPHARGSTPSSKTQTLLRKVYPACAGIHLARINQREARVGLPRMRGDPPCGD